MKHLARLLSLLILVSAGIFFTNCDNGGDPKKSDEDKQLEKLEGIWTVTGAEFDGSTARQDEFLGAELEITSNQEFNFSQDGGVDACPWPASVDWEFGANVMSQIIRLDSNLPSGDDDVSLTYNVEGDILSITIADYSGTGYNIAGKAKSVNGDWEFTFERN